jgi:hypothetical protein
MREIIMKYYRGQALDLGECIKVMEEYMLKINRVNPKLIQHIIDPMNVMGNHMLQQAVKVSIEYLSGEYNINILSSKEGRILMVY